MLTLHITSHRCNAPAHFPPRGYQDQDGHQQTRWGQAIGRQGCDQRCRRHHGHQVHRRPARRHEGPTATTATTVTVGRQGALLDLQGTRHSRQRQGKGNGLEAPEPKRWQRGQQRWGQGSLGGPVGREEQQRPEATCHEGAQQWTQLSLLHASRNFRIDLLWCYKIAKTREPRDTGSHPKLRPALDCRSSPAPEPEHCLNQDRSSNHEHFFQQSSSQSCSLTNSEWSEWAYDRSQPTPSQLQ